MKRLVAYFLRGLAFVVPISLALVPTLLAVPASAQCVTNELEMLIGSHSHPDDHFGTGVGLNASGTTAIVGVPYDDYSGASVGSAYVLALAGSTWTTQAKLEPGDASIGAQCGRSVALTRLA